jgi:hypothetical protein
MWESDSPFQVSDVHASKDSVELIKSRLDFLTNGDREWLLRKTAEKFFFDPLEMTRLSGECVVVTLRVTHSSRGA